VDGSQSIGHRPFSLRSLSADAVCAPAHKGLFGVQGAGFLWLKDGHGLLTTVEGGSGSGSLDPEMPSELPERMEAGTPPTPAIAALGAGVRYLRKITPEEVEAKETALVLRLRERLDGLRGLQVYTSGRGGILSMASSAITPDRMTELLDAHDICVRGGLHCAPLAHAALGTQRTGTVRVSFSYHNCESDADRLAAAVAEILHNV
jgi:selenocysteine lyase/cysteine desulfurase